MSKYGAIDIGTNSVRLLIGRVDDQGQLEPLVQELITTRLGEKMWEKPLLTQEAIAATIRALQHFTRLLQEQQVAGVRAVATSAVRESLNQQEFLTRAARETGLEIEVISGEEEAQLAYAGVSWASTGQKPILLVDIGGGSTEFLYRSQGKLLVESLKIGAVRLTGAPMSQEELAQLIRPVAAKLGLQPAHYRLLGVGGTITTAVAIEKKLTSYDYREVHGHRLSLATVRRIRDQLAQMSLAERQAVPGLAPERADIIVAGLEILVQVLKTLGQTQLEVSEADLLYGLILAQVG